MKILSGELKTLFEAAVHAAFPELGMDDLMKAVTVEEPRDSAHGDYASGLAMRLTKVLGKSPAAIAEAVIAGFPKDYRVEKLEFAAPGFINVTLSGAFLQETVKTLESGFSIERGVKTGADHTRPVIVEYSSTNAAKHMGVHHIITTILGDAIANLFGFMGHEVIRINHLGDWGTHFGKIIYAIEQWGDKAEVEAHPNDEFTRLYVKFHEEAEKNPALEDEARKLFKALETGDPERLALWKWVVHESLMDLEKIFKRLGVEFDYITGESFYLKMADEVLADGIAKGVFVEGEGGALIAPIEGAELPALVRKADGTTLYLTRDLATVRYRTETWHPELILYVVDHAQSLHFQQNFAVAKLLGYSENTGLEHISFGRMNFAGGAMSSRKGNVIRLNDMLNEAAKRAGELAASKSVDFPREELYAMAEILGVASVKYAVLSQDRNKDILFDWDKIISLEGNSAPYLLYSYARAATILHKAGTMDLGGLPQFTDPAEIALAQKLVKFPEAFERAVTDRKPHVISTALYELCQEFNRFYGNVPVLKAETPEKLRTRLGLVQSFLFEVKVALAILGIPALERM
jgi:arginyl-tRNA synthetase